MFFLHSIILYVFGFPDNDREDNNREDNDRDGDDREDNDRDGDDRDGDDRDGDDRDGDDAIGTTCDDGYKRLFCGFIVSRYFFLVFPFELNCRENVFNVFPNVFII